MDSAIREAAKGIKLVACDLDGTLLKKDKTVSEHTLEVIKALGKKGIIFTVCTGRVYAMLHHILDMLRLDRGVVCANGLEVYDLRDNTPVFTSTMPPDTATAVARFCAKNRMNFVVTGDGMCWMPDYCSRVPAYQRHNEECKKRGWPLYSINLLKQSEFEAVELDNIIKVVFWDDNGALAKMRDYVDNDLRGAYVTTTDVEIYEVMPAGVDKGSGLVALAKHFGIAANECLTFGDYYNDVPMFERAGLSGAMLNSIDEIKRRASFVTEYDNDADGVARTLEELFL